MAKSPYQHGRKIIPVSLNGVKTIPDLIKNVYAATCFEARYVSRGAELYERMINDGDTIWLGISGAGIVGGLGGVVSDLIKKGFIDAICSTGAQAYHDLHFAYGLPVRQIDPVRVDDNDMRKHGDVRIYDLVIREKETLLKQDKIIRKFVERREDELLEREMSTAEFLNVLGKYVNSTAPHPERSYIATAEKYDVPVFLDSSSNSALGEDLARLKMEGIDVQLSHHLDLLYSAAIQYNAKQTGFVELGGGGPKNFIQTTGPTISQNLQMPFEGADRGLQITLALERDGGLSGCTFSEAVSWGKYKKADSDKLVQIYADYAVVFPLIALYAKEVCRPRARKRLFQKLGTFYDKLEADFRAQHGHGKMLIHAPQKIVGVEAKKSKKAGCC
jgi:deoxyhypusine synthase